MRTKRSPRFQPSILTRWIVPAVLVLLGAALLVMLALVVFLPVR